MKNILDKLNYLDGPPEVGTKIRYEAWINDRDCYRVESIDEDYVTVVYVDLRDNSTYLNPIRFLRNSFNWPSWKIV